MRPLEPYDETTFAALHAPGTKMLTASLVPGLFGELPWASRYAGVRSSVALSVGIAAFCTLLFIQLLGLPLPLTGPWAPRFRGGPSGNATLQARASRHGAHCRAT